MRRYFPYLGLTAALAAITLAAFFTRGGLLPTLRDSAGPTLPENHAAYGRMITAGALSRSVAAQRWTHAAAEALAAAALLGLPYQETVVIRADAPRADAWKFTVRAGQALTVTIKPDARFEGALFADLFLVPTAPAEPSSPSSPPKLVESIAIRTALSQVEGAAQGGGPVPVTIVRAVSEDQVLLVRVQGELLAEGAYSVIARANPTLEFPVKDVPDSAVQSKFGVPRAGGTRSHEGVDIFAPRGTPVLASSDGRISRVGQSALGGLHIWQRSSKIGRSFYYAHLDAALVADGEQVTAGQPIGLVGNSGNAKSTPPHLHFGLYQWLSGAVDPWPYINRQRAPEPAPRPNERWMRVASDTMNFRAGPSTRSHIIDALDRGQLVRVVGATSGGWLRVRTPSGQGGYVYANLLSSIDRVLADTVVGVAVPVRARAEARSPNLGALVPGQRVQVLGTDPLGSLIRWPSNQTGEDAPSMAWISFS